jgi:diguanylate cyclase (GGDEF)-like protein
MIPQHPSASGASILLLAADGCHAALRAGLDADHRVVACADLARAECALADDAPDLLLLDPMAAGAGDAGALAALLQRFGAEDLPIILLGNPPASVIERALELGVKDLIATEEPLALALRRVASQLDLRYCRALLRAQSLQDGLTGLANRARFEEFLPAAFANAQRRREPIALILFDIDAFAAYNAARGHAAGDEVLLHVGRTLSSARRRPLDLFARHAGDGFACVLPDTDLTGARAVAELVLADVDALMLAHPASPVADCITVSLGIAARTPAPGESPAQLVEQASQALQRAKRGGRHRVSD